MEHKLLLQGKDELQGTHFRKRLPDVQDSKEGLLQELHLVGEGQQLRTQAGLAINGTHDALAQLDEKRQHWYRKPGRHAQAFVTKFADFVQVYSGIVDVARQAGGPYAEVAYGTLSIFFMFVNTLEELQNSFPRVKMAEELYSQARVKERVWKVYHQVILFSKEATEYFLANTSVRVLKAIIRPAPLGVDKAVGILFYYLAEVNAEIGMMLHQRVRHISEQNDGIKAQNENLLLEIRALKRQWTIMKENADQELSRKVDENLEYLRRILGGDLQEHRDPRFCRKHLEDAFPEALEAFGVRQGWSVNYHQMTSKLLVADAAYQSWRECLSSCVLVIAGSTALQGRAPRSQSGCWLSPAALHVFDSLQSKDTTIVAFYTCQPNYKVDETSSRQVVSSLVCQLLAWKPEVLRHTMKELKATVKSDAWSSKVIHVALASHFGLLDRVIGLLPADKAVTLVLDRLDLCREPTHLILQYLQGLFEHRPNGLKILVVMERISNDYVRGELQDFLKHGAKNKSFGRVNWDQTPKGY
ncbi:MAG: hypothetical protein Q9211_003473 [Gyalolechia sp. 1 TL-2023]